MEKRQLILVPTAGLCNRMNAILCAIALQKDLSWDINVFWEKDEDCCADFYDLFMPIPNVNVHKLTSWFYKPGVKKNLFLPYLLRRFHFDLCLNGNKSTFKDIKSTLLSAQSIYIHSFNRFSTQDITYSIHKYFTPAPSIQEMIADVTKTYSSNTIGVHIRRTDNIKAIENNPLEKYHDLISKELAKNPGTCFYIATDDESIKEELRATFGNCIITRKNVINRNTLEGMREAVVDLYCLAKTNIIIGSSHSTFSLMASWLYNTQLVI